MCTEMQGNSNKQVVILVMAYDTWHCDIWLEWARHHPIVFLVHFSDPIHDDHRNIDPGVHVTRTVKSSWANLMSLQMHLLHEVQHTYQHFKSCMFISGECVPCIQPSQFMSTLSGLNRHSICQYDPVEPPQHVRGMQLYEGQNWMLLDRTHVQYMSRLKQTTIDDVASVKLHTSPGHHAAANNDEFGIISLLVNSRHCNEIYNSAITDYICQYGIRHPLQIDRHNFDILQNVLLNKDSALDTDHAWCPWECAHTRFMFRKISHELQGDVWQILKKANIL